MWCLVALIHFRHVWQRLCGYAALGLGFAALWACGFVGIAALGMGHAWHAAMWTCGTWYFGKCTCTLVEWWWGSGDGRSQLSGSMGRDACTFLLFLAGRTAWLLSLGLPDVGGMHNRLAL